MVLKQLESSSGITGALLYDRNFEVAFQTRGVGSDDLELEAASGRKRTAIEKQSCCTANKREKSIDHKFPIE